MRADAERPRWISISLLVIVLLGAGALIALLSVQPPPAVPAPATRSVPQAISGAQLRYVLFLVVILVLVLAVSLLALLRWSRHFRRLILHKPPPPTPAEDVWAMHRLEEEPEGPTEITGHPEGS